MDGLTQAVQGIMGALTPAASAPAPLWQQLLTGGMFGAGELGNLLQAHKQSEYQDYITNLMKNPQLVSQMITKAQQPLSNALVQGINNRVQGDMAQRGLAQAPGIFAGTEAQALAPFELQQQQNAQQQVMQLLGLPGAATNINAPGQNMSPALQMFLRSFGTPGAKTQQLPPAWNTNQSAPPNTGITPPDFNTVIPPQPTFPDTSDWGLG